MRIQIDRLCGPWQPSGLGYVRMSRPWFNWPWPFPLPSRRVVDRLNDGILGLTITFVREK